MITKFIIKTLSIFFLASIPFHLMAQPEVILMEKNGAKFLWDLQTDQAVLNNTSNNKKIWSGSLLPAIWYTMDSTNFFYAKAKVQINRSQILPENAVVPFSFSNIGSGNIYMSMQSAGLVIDSVQVNWSNEIPLIHSLYFGTDLLTEEESQVVPSLEYPFWPDWSADGYCIPTAKGAPIQSFFRFWRFGHTSIPLGSFGPSLGTPYAAAFPRPLYSAAMGGNHGWVAFGSGTIMDAAMTLQVKASTGCIEYLYREDIWGGYEGQEREWHKPLIISWSDESAWDAYHALFSHFPDSPAVDSSHQLSHWNTWGDFKQRNFDMKAITQKAIDFEAELITWDMLWETFECSGIPDTNRFPNFRKDLQYIENKDLKVGFWQSVVWVEDYESLGLTTDDIILGKDGKPRKVNWLMSPYQTSQMYYALDPSSPRTIEFLRKRTQNIVKKYDADLFKLDFGYGVPSPNVGVPRDPALRGENYAYSLIKTISQAAKEINPDITIQYYGIHPLMKKVQNLLALDDMGDAGNQEPAGHGQWSIWSALAGLQGMAIMASSGYDWDADAEILLNTAVIGSPGLVLPIHYRGGEIPTIMKSRRLALARWYRKTTGWKPLWLNSHKGDLNQEPTPYCWGRLEKFAGQEVLTSLALREENKQTLANGKLNNLEFEGDWALIAQDNKSIFNTSKLALIPFKKGFIRIPLAQKPEEVKVIYQDDWQKKEYEWQDGFLTIEVEDQEIDNALLGFEISQ